MRHLFRRLCPFLLIVCSALGADSFYLKNGDRVVFYGDSITDQRLYTTFVEDYVVTRFPRRNIRFVHSGW
ncbi:MAG: GDSL family lipase, partial [Bryobacteraceae bacterium]